MNASAPAGKNNRILVIDDNRAIHEDFRKILSNDDPLAAAEARLFGKPEAVSFQIDSACQGEEGLKLVQQVLAEGRPYAMAFVDVRMPPGWDGVETARKIWEVYPDLQIVICTAYSDYSWNELSDELGCSDQLLILKKPFDTIEVTQLAHTLTEKWRLYHESKRELTRLHQAVLDRTRDLDASRIAALNMMEDAVQARKKAEEGNVDLKRQMAEGARAEEQIREQARLLDLAQDAVIIRDLEDRVQFWNASAERSYGWTAAEACGRNIRDLIYLDSREFEPAKQILLDQEYWIGEMQQVTKERRPLLTTSRWTLVRDAHGVPKSVLVINTDITERKQLENQLRQAQKMEAVGQLAGGVAHDFNNMLCVIRGNAELVLMDADQLSDQARECLKQVTAASERAANLTRQLLAFGRKQTKQSHPLNLNDVIANLTKMLGRIIGEDLHLQCNYATHLPFVQADVGMMEQVLLNLVVNARDAMPLGGQLLIATDKTRVDADYARTHPEARAGEFISLIVSDTGTGIAPEHLPHIFEPFYTTKEVGKGTGLGLATVHGIVKQHQGWIEVSTLVGVGTSFKIFLPAIAPPAIAIAAPEAKSVLRGGNEQILLVEDDSAVRRLTRRLLEGVGYRVVEAVSGREALEVWRSQKEKIDLLLTDIVMPDSVTGQDLAEQLRAESPTLKVIFMSGYSADVVGKDTAFFKRSRSLLLQKPFSSNTLLEAIRQCLDEGSKTALLGEF